MLWNLVEEDLRTVLHDQRAWKKAVKLVTGKGEVKAADREFSVKYIWVDEIGKKLDKFFNNEPW